MNVLNQKLRFGSKGMELVREFEGYHTRLSNDSVQAYWDATGKVWTIGYGVTEGVTKGMVLTRPEAEAMFKAELIKHENFVKELVTVKLDQNEFDALVSLCYNMGPTNLRKSTLLKKLNAGDRKGAADAFLLYNKSGGKKLRGLERRRSAERQLFLTWTPEDIKSEGTPWWVDIYKKVGTALTGIVGMLATAVDGVKQFITDHPAAFTVGVMISIYVAIQVLQWFIQKDHEDGIYNPDNATNAPPVYVPPATSPKLGVN